MCENKVPYLKGNRNLHAKHFVVDNIIRLHRFMSVCTYLKNLKLRHCILVIHVSKNAKLIELHRSRFYPHAFTKVLSNNYDSFLITFYLMFKSMSQVIVSVIFRRFFFINTNSHTYE